MLVGLQQKVRGAQYVIRCYPYLLLTCAFLPSNSTEAPQWGAADTEIKVPSIKNTKREGCPG